MEKSISENTNGASLCLPLHMRYKHTHIMTCSYVLQRSACHACVANSSLLLVIAAILFVAAAHLD